MVRFLPIDAALAACACALLAACLPGPNEEASSDAERGPSEGAGSGATASLPPLQDHRDAARTAGLSPIVTLRAAVDEVPVFGMTEVELMLEPAVEGPWTIQWEDVRSMRFVVEELDASGSVRRTIAPLCLPHDGSWEQGGGWETLEMVDASWTERPFSRERVGALVALEYESMPLPNYDANFDFGTPVELAAGVLLRAVGPLGALPKADSDSRPDSPAPCFVFDRPERSYRVLVEARHQGAWVPVSNVLALRTGPAPIASVAHLAAALDGGLVAQAGGFNAYGRWHRSDRDEHAVAVVQSGDERAGLSQFARMAELEGRAVDVRRQQRWQDFNAPPAARDAAAWAFREAARQMREALEGLDAVQRCQPTRVSDLGRRLDELERWQAPPDGLRDSDSHR